jgi:hypothetical protein
MQHHVIFWAFGKREADVGDEELRALRDREGRGEIYLEFVDGHRRSLVWDGERHRWNRSVAAALTEAPTAA